jgi:hypothetical protein
MAKKETYQLEYDQPIEQFPHLILRVHIFKAAADEKAVEAMLAFLATTNCVEGKPARYGRPRNLSCVTGPSRQQIPIPWERVPRG